MCINKFYPCKLQVLNVFPMISSEITGFQTLQIEDASKL